MTSNYSQHDNEDDDDDVKTKKSVCIQSTTTTSMNNFSMGICSLSLRTRSPLVEIIFEFHNIRLFFIIVITKKHSD